MDAQAAARAWIEAWSRDVSETSNASSVSNTCSAMPARCPSLRMTRGSVTVTVVPFPTLLATAIVPPCAFTSVCAIARPRPEPRESRPS